MGTLTISMVDRTLAALDKRDVKAARALCREDDEIDSLYDRAYQELISTMVSDPQAHNRGDLHDLDHSQPREDRGPSDQHLRAGDLPGHGPRGGIERLQVLRSAAPELW